MSAALGDRIVLKRDMRVLFEEHGHKLEKLPWMIVIIGNICTDYGYIIERFCRFL